MVRAPAPLIWSSEYRLSPPVTPRDSRALGLRDFPETPCPPHPRTLSLLCMCFSVPPSLCLSFSGFSPLLTHTGKGSLFTTNAKKCHTKRVQQLALQRTPEPLAKSPAVSICLCLRGAEPGVNLAEADGDIGPVFSSPPPSGTLSQLKICPFSNTPGSGEDPVLG